MIEQLLVNVLPAPLLIAEEVRPEELSSRQLIPRPRREVARRAREADAKIAVGGERQDRVARFAERPEGDRTDSSLRSERRAGRNRRGDARDGLEGCQVHAGRQPQVFPVPVVHVGPDHASRRALQSLEVREEDAVVRGPRRWGSRFQVVHAEQARYRRILGVRRYFHQLGGGGGGRNSAARLIAEDDEQQGRDQRGGGSRPAQKSKTAAPPQPPRCRRQAETEPAQNQQNELSAQDPIAHLIQQERTEHLGLQRRIPTRSQEGADRIPEGLRLFKAGDRVQPDPFVPECSSGVGDTRREGRAR